MTDSRNSQSEKLHQQRVELRGAEGDLGQSKDMFYQSHEWLEDAQRPLEFHQHDEPKSNMSLQQRESEQAKDPQLRSPLFERQKDPGESHGTYLNYGHKGRQPAEAPSHPQNNATMLQNGIQSPADHEARSSHVDSQGTMDRPRSSAQDDENTSKEPALGEKTPREGHTKSFARDAEDPTPQMNEKETDSKIPEEPSPGESVEAPAAEELKKGPPGGYDATQIPHRPPGYTLKFTIHKAVHLPISDIATLSCDPYVRLELKTGLPMRHKEDPPLMFRTRTIWRSTEPAWEQSWIVANVPSSGCRLKARLYDEDSNDKDDRLGNAHITIPNLYDRWEGLEYRPFKIMKRSGSWRAYAVRGLAVCLRRTAGMDGELYVSVECLGRTPDNEGGRAYTIGKQYWCKNYSPMLGRLVGSKEPDFVGFDNRHNRDHDRMTGENTSGQNNPPEGQEDHDEAPPDQHEDEKGRQRYNFQSNQMQLQGPVPPELYHRYVEFRPFVKSLFTGSGMRGLILNKALHAQHTKVYNFNKDTRYGVYDGPCSELTMKFLELAHFDIGGRIHTYVLTLDGLLRFTETGKEFSIDLLSKHTMHSDASIYIAYSGEFFIRRLKNKFAPAPLSQQAAEGDEAAQNNQSHPPDPVAGGPPSEPAPRDAAQYELIIDNDSGTYRPNAKLLPLLRQFLQHNFPGLKIVTLDCQKDEELMNKLKKEQRERRQKEGNQMVFTQISRSSSLSSDDDERLDDLAHQQDQDEANAQPKHQLAEAIGPFVNDHERTRKLLQKA
ncbi:MAG: hypothetical protein Q9162_000714 [Coniocarpon cinnabarinum]